MSDGIESRPNGEQLGAVSGDFRSGVEELFEQYDVREWIAAVRLPTTGHLDMAATVSNLGSVENVVLDLDYTPRDSGSGATTERYGSYDLHVRTDRGPETTLITFGHELGHYFLAAVCGVPLEDQDDVLGHWETEDFCELFGLEVVMPTYDLQAIKDVNKELLQNLMEKYCINLVETLLQLMIAGSLPPKVAIEAPSLSADTSDEQVEKAVRGFVCLDCYLDSMGVCRTKGVPYPVFDFSEVEGLSKRFRHCDSENY